MEGELREKDITSEMLPVQQQATRPVWMPPPTLLVAGQSVVVVNEALVAKFLGQIPHMPSLGMVRRELPVIQQILPCPSLLKPARPTDVAVVPFAPRAQSEELCCVPESPKLHISPETNHTSLFASSPTKPGCSPAIYDQETTHLSPNDLSSTTSLYHDGYHSSMSASVAAFLCSEREKLERDSDSEIEDATGTAESEVLLCSPVNGQCSRNDRDLVVCREPPCKRQKGDDSYLPSTCEHPDLSLKERERNLVHPQPLREDADDGSDTVHQALPLEAASEHSLLPSRASCRDGRGGGGGSGGLAGGQDVGSSQEPAAEDHLPTVTLQHSPESQTIVEIPSLVQDSPQKVPDADGSSPPLHTLYDSALDDTDSSTVLSLPMTAIDQHNVKLYSNDSRCITDWQFLRAKWYQNDVMETTRLNLSEPRLRLGLSKHYKRTQLHHIE